VDGNRLYYGDNLDVLRRHIADESVDLVYLDPPFKSNQDYNVLFADHGVRAAAQIKAFEDTWSWDEVAAAAYDDVVTGGAESPTRWSPSAGSSAITTCLPTSR
jgi:site-specific DNA-methyltransferase (adenine-specific)